MQSVQAEPAKRLLSETAVVIGEVRTVHQGRVTDKHVAGQMIPSHSLALSSNALTSVATISLALTENPSWTRFNWYNLHLFLY
jgi:hypothetical protein